MDQGRDGPIVKPPKTESEPCHTQLWNALDQLDGSVERLRCLYNTLAGTPEPDSETCDKNPPPPFAAVISRASKRVIDAHEFIDNLRTDFETLCLRGGPDGRDGR
jgi:hypothetical protein